MKEENPVYVRLTSDEALQAKRDILFLQGDLLRIVKIIRNYKALRLEELRTKAKTYRKLKELVLTIKKIKTDLPKIRTSSIKKEENPIRKTVNKTQNTEEDNTRLEDAKIVIKERITHNLTERKSQ